MLKIVTAIAKVSLIVTLTPTLVLTMGADSAAMPVFSQLLKPKAKFIEEEGGLYEPLDLKAKSIKMMAAVETCGANLERKARTLNYSCTMKIPSKAKISRLQNQTTPNRLEVIFGGLKKDVVISVTNDAREITYSLEFDSTGIDFDVLKFNDDFFQKDAKLAHLMLAEAMKKPVRLEVLESK